MSRCKYGKLKHPSRGRRCKTRRGARRGRHHRRRASPLLSGVGIGVVLVGAAVLLPQVIGGSLSGFSFTRPFTKNPFPWRSDTAVGSDGCFPGWHMNPLTGKCVPDYNTTASY